MEINKAQDLFSYKKTKLEWIRCKGKNPKYETAKNKNKAKSYDIVMHKQLLINP